MRQVEKFTNYFVKIKNLQRTLPPHMPGEAKLLAALLDNGSRDEAVQSAVRGSLQEVDALDFNAWLPMAVQTGLPLAAERFQASVAS